MKRRDFIKGSVAALGVVGVVSLTTQPKYASAQTILKSFPKAYDAHNIVSDTFVGVIKTPIEGHYRFVAQSYIVDNTVVNDFDDFLKQVRMVLTVDNGDPESISHGIFRATNRVAANTKRGRANHYAIVEDGAIVWYKGKFSDYDTPIKRTVNGYFAQNNALAYFEKVGFDPTKETVDYLDSVFGNYGIVRHS
jgi:hypothetical protein